MELVNKDTRNAYWADAAEAFHQNHAPAEPQQSTQPPMYDMYPYTCDNREDVGINGANLHRVDRGRRIVLMEGYCAVRMSSASEEAEHGK